jgi:hypothetical protein
MRICIQPFSLQKAGNKPEEYEDAFWPTSQGRFEGRNFRLALADGATESSFSGLWAQMLVHSYGRSPLTPLNLQSRVEKRGRRWAQHVTAKPLPWFALEKVQRGSFATLLGLSLRSDEDVSSAGGQWTALAIGDSCLFQIRASELITSFPLTSAEQFGNTPLLVSTHPLSNQSLWTKLADFEQKGVWQPGDKFLLMTDALAQWFLNEVETGERPWLTLFSMAEQSKSIPNSFAQWINDLRLSKAIRNDDVTLLIIQMEINEISTSD